MEIFVPTRFFAAASSPRTEEAGEVQQNAAHDLALLGIEPAAAVRDLGYHLSATTDL